MSTRFILEPGSVSDLSLFDTSAHRAASHPWYNRYHRTGADPVSAAGFGDLQPVLWALFMTGWEIANDFVENDNHGASSLLVASASSKTAFSLAHSLAAADTGIEIVGLTSEANAELVHGFGCYDTVLTYGSLDLPAIGGPAAFVDMAGNAALATEGHPAYHDRFARAWAGFGAWASSLLEVRVEAGPAAIRTAYLDALTAGTKPTEALVLSFD